MKKKPEIESPGAALVRRRWEKTTPEERKEIGRRLAEARWGPKKGRNAKKARTETGGKER